MAGREDGLLFDLPAPADRRRSRTGRLPPARREPLPGWFFGSLIPNGYRVILADPAWRFMNYSAKGEGRNPSAHYDCMPLDDIQRLPVAQLADPSGCLLWMWATNPMLPQALETLDRWGFAFATAGVWHKKTRHGKDAFGTGYVLRSASEPFLIGKIGKPRLGPAATRVRGLITTIEDAVEDLVIEAAMREHSRKPDEQYRLLDMLVPEGARCELFARQSWPGYAVWGNQTNKFAPGEWRSPAAAGTQPGGGGDG